MDLQTWLATYWQPLLIGAVLGLIVGWLLTWLLGRGSKKELEARVSDLSGRLTAAEKAQADARQQSQSLEANLKTALANVATAKGQIETLQAQLGEAADQRAAIVADLEARTQELAELQADRDRLAEQLSAVQSAQETTSEDLAQAKKDLEAAAEALANKEVALNEAYLRAVKLQRELMENQSALAATQTELANLRRDVVSLTSLNQDLEGRLQNSRGEVAGELALLTSTMLRMKEDQLTQANHRIAALTAEIEAMKAGKVVSH